MGEWREMLGDDDEERTREREEEATAHPRARQTSPRIHERATRARDEGKAKGLRGIRRGVGVGEVGVEESAFG